MHGPSLAHRAGYPVPEDVRDLDRPVPPVLRPHTTILRASISFRTESQSSTAPNSLSASSEPLSGESPTPGPSITRVATFSSAESVRCSSLKPSMPPQTQDERERRLAGLRYPEISHNDIALSWSATERNLHSLDWHIEVARGFQQHLLRLPVRCPLSLRVYGGVSSQAVVLVGEQVVLLRGLRIPSLLRLDGLFLVQASRPH